MTPAEFRAITTPNLTIAEREKFAARSDNPSFWRGQIAAYAPNLTAAERDDFAARSNDPARCRGQIAAKHGEKS